MEEEPQNPSSDSILAGFLASIVAHVIVAGALAIIDRETMSIWMLTIGLAQLPYMLILVAYFNKQSKPLAAKGVWIAMAIAFLINASCWGIGLATFSLH